MNELRKLVAAVSIAAAPAFANAAQDSSDLLSLLQSGSLVADDITLSGFSFSDEGLGVSNNTVITAVDINISLETTGANATVIIDYDPDIDVGLDDFLEHFVDFNVDVAAQPGRLITAAEIQMAVAVAGGIESVTPEDNFVQFEVLDDLSPLTANLEVSVQGGQSQEPQNPSESFAGVDSFVVETVIEAAHEDGEGGFVQADSFTITFTLDSEIDEEPEVPTVPVPAALPMALAGIGLMTWLGRRKKSA